MKYRQHRCPYYLLQIKKSDLDEFKKQQKTNNDLLNKYQNQLNLYSNKITTYESIFQKILNLIKPIFPHYEPKSLIKCVEDSYLSPLTKSNALILVKKYINFCNEKINNKLNFSQNNEFIEEIPSIYDPENAYEFITKKKPLYNRTTVKKHLNTLLRLLKIATNNPFLSYSLPLGHGESTKLKHLLTKEEIRKFIRYLNDNKFYIVILIVMLLYKFGVRIGSIAKMKCSDFGEDNLLIFREKNNMIIRRFLLSETSSLLRRLIKECNLKEDDYLFYDFKFKNDIIKRIKFFSQKIRDLMLYSNSFNNTTLETISAHSFRVFHAVETFENKGIKTAQEELGHKHNITTYNSYIKPEIRNLNIREEKNTLLLNKGKVIKSKGNINNINKENEESIDSNPEIDTIKEESSFTSDDEGEDILDDDFNIGENIFYFEGHFYDDVDYRSYISSDLKNKLKEDPIDNIDDIYKELIDKTKFKKENSQIKKFKNRIFVFNKPKKKREFKKNKNSFIILGDYKELKNSIDIMTENKDMIHYSKIKKKQECHNLSEEDEIILAKTMNLNKEGIYYNMKMEFNNGIYYVKSTNEIKENTLITIISGRIYYYKNYINNELESEEKQNLIIYYFRTANHLYDRIISIKKESLTNYLFPKLDGINSNLIIKKIITLANGNIILCIVTKDLIKKGEILNLNRNLLLN